MFQQINIIDFKSEMATEMAAVSDSFFGKDYFNNRILPLFHHQKNSIFKVATTNHTLVGFALGFCINKSEIDDFLKVSLPKTIEIPENIAILNTVAVKTEFQKRHIGKQLIDSLLYDFESQNILHCLALGWKHADVIYADQLNQKMGFYPIFEIPDFWRDDVLSNKYKCSVCGENCHCSAIIYYKKW